MKTCVVFAGTLRNFDRKRFEEHFLQNREDVRMFASCNSRFLKAPPYIHQSVQMYSVPRDWNFIKQNHAWNGYNTASMYYHNSRALEIAMKEFPEAEVVVKYRSDVVSSHTFPHAEGALDEKTIYLPNGNDYGGVNDQLAYGTPESMAVYCSLYDKIEEYVRNGVPYHPETLLSHHLRSNAIQTKRFDFAYGLEPSRHDAWN